MITRVSVVLGAGALAAGLALAFFCWRDHSDIRFENYAYQEFVTPHPEDGFEYIVGYKAPQSFYWREIVTSKEYKLEVLRQLGETPQARWGLLYAVSAERYLLSEPKRKESFYLVVDFLDTPDAIPWGDDSAATFMAYARAFVEVLRRRGIEASPLGEIVFRSRDIASWRIIIRRHWLEVLLVGCTAVFLAALLIQRKEKKPNKAPEPTPTSVTSPAAQEPRQP